MGDTQFWLYVIIGIIFLVGRLMKKPQAPEGQDPNFDGKQSNQNDDKSARRVDTGERQLTFEELLREITESKAEKKPQAVPKPTTINYDEDLSDESDDLEEVTNPYQKHNKVYAEYEEAKREAFVRPSLEDTMKLSDTDLKFGRFKGFEREVEVNLLNQYLKEFKDPQGLKKAIVMSEILQRKF
jgi:hypothetical protein